MQCLQREGEEIRSEYNRCAVPRLSCKLGDKEYKAYEKEVQTDLQKEEQQVSKIRELVKERNRNRGRGPPAKRRKVEDDGMYPEQESPTEQTDPTTKQEKRKPGEDIGPENKKKRRGENDIRNLLKPPR